MSEAKYRIVAALGPDGKSAGYWVQALCGPWQNAGGLAWVSRCWCAELQHAEAWVRMRCAGANSDVIFRYDENGKRLNDTIGSGNKAPDAHDDPDDPEGNWITETSDIQAFVVGVPVPPLSRKQSKDDDAD